VGLPAGQVQDAGLRLELEQIPRMAAFPRGSERSAELGAASGLRSPTFSSGSASAVSPPPPSTNFSMACWVTVARASGEKGLEM
jgi:hypothetical protein